MRDEEKTKQRLESHEMPYDLVFIPEILKDGTRVHIGIIYNIQIQNYLVFLHLKR